MYCDVWRSDKTADTESEFDLSKKSKATLIYERMPIHMTPFRPKFSTSSSNQGQWTKVIANIRKNYNLERGDTLQSTDGRTFTVNSLEDTDGAFMGNSTIVELTEMDAAPR